MNKSSKGRSRGGNGNTNMRPVSSEIRFLCSGQQSKTQQHVPQIRTCAYACQDADLDPSTRSIEQSISSNKTSSNPQPALVRSRHESLIISNIQRDKLPMFPAGAADELNISLKNSTLALITSVEPRQLNENLSSFNNERNEEKEIMERYLAEVPASYCWERIFCSIPEFSDDLPPPSMGRRRVNNPIPRQSPNIENTRRNDQENDNISPYEEEERADHSNEVHHNEGGDEVSNEKHSVQDQQPQETERTYCFDPIDHDAPFEESQIEACTIPYDDHLSTTHMKGIVNWLKKEKDGRMMKTRSIQEQIKEVESAISITRGDFEDFYFTIQENRTEDHSNWKQYFSGEFRKFTWRFVAIDKMLKSLLEDCINITNATQNAEKSINKLTIAVHNLYFYNAHGRYPNNIQEGGIPTCPLSFLKTGENHKNRNLRNNEDGISPERRNCDQDRRDL